MKVTYNWLKDYVKINVTPEILAEKLTMAGLEVTSLEKIGNDSLFDMEITSNRADLLSVIGIAREVASFAGKRLALPKLLNFKPSKKNKEGLAIQIVDKKYCSRYIGIVVRNLTIGPSPAWLKSRLEKVGIRSINNIVDITNYCQLEWGQPIHAFDLDKLQGNIYVRCARKGEKIITIDGESRNLDEPILIIADSRGPIAIAGIMGGKDTEVLNTTKNILLELASFNSVAIRRGSRKLGLSSESSYRFERGVDLDNCMNVAKRCAGLILNLASSKQSPYIAKVLDTGKKKDTGKKTISFRPAYANKILGANIKDKQIQQILASLGLRPISKTKNSLKFLIPSFRKDLRIEEDLIEEIARIYGYDKICKTLPYIKPRDIPPDPKSSTISIIKDSLIKQGLNEIISYSLIAGKDLDNIGHSFGQLMNIENPLTTNQELLRPTLIVGMLSCVANNLNHQNTDIKIFELGNIFQDLEASSLAIALLGDDYVGVTPELGKFSIPQTFYHLKGIVEKILFELGIKNYCFRPKDSTIFTPNFGLVLNIEGLDYGILGRVSGRILEKFDIKKENVFFAEIRLRDLEQFINLERRFLNLNPYPFITRHISLFLQKDLPVQKVINLIKDLKLGHLVDINIIDFYLGKNAPEGYKGLTLSLKYQAQDHTLKDQEIESHHSLVSRALQEKFQAQIR